MGSGLKIVCVAVIAWIASALLVLTGGGCIGTHARAPDQPHSAQQAHSSFELPTPRAAYKVNANGHFVPDTSVPSFLTATAGAAITAFQACYIKAADSKIYPLDGTETAAGNFAGISDAAYASAAVANYYPPGTQLSGLTGLTIGDLYAKEDASLVPYASVGSNKYTRRVAIADSATQITVATGEVVLHP